MDKKITKELKEEGTIRELIRQIQDMRRQAGLTRKDRIELWLSTKQKSLDALFSKWQEFIFKETLSQKSLEEKIKFDLEKEINLEEGGVKVGIRKIE